MSMVLTWVIAAALSGASIGILGSWVVGMRMPFLGIAMAHAALAGGVIGALFDVTPELTAFIATLLTGFCVGLLNSSSVNADHSVSDRISSIVLTLTMGIAFLCIGIDRGELSSMLGLLWGNILFITNIDIIFMAIAAALLMWMWWRDGTRLDALAFSPRMARSSGICDRRLTVGFLVIASVIIAVNLRTIGGLLLYALLVNPAAAAYCHARTMRQARLYALAAGLASSLGGFAISWKFDLPTGACICLTSVAIYIVAQLTARRS